MDNRHNLFSEQDNITAKASFNSDTGEKEIHFYLNNDKISPWHELEFRNKDETINMICEIPRYTRKKYEIRTDLKYNPIVQDTINEKPREYIYGDMLFNYGAIPQTWEDPNILCDGTMKHGDNDPLDIIDIGDYQSQVGMVYRVKVIGVLALIDEDETDWKVISINIQDSNAKNINNLESVKYYKPGCLEAIKHWFEHYKTVRGKEKNKFGFNGEYKGVEYTNLVIDKCHKMWIKIKDNL